MITEKAYFAGGCFWCTEAVFKRITGVLKVTPGYSGGHMINPNYVNVSSGNTGHAESVEVIFNPEKISYQDLLRIFFKTHDPTTPNRQGADIGSQYRSVIFYVNLRQKKMAEDAIRKLLENKTYKNVVTEVVPFNKFYPAEVSHKNYYELNRNQPYCRIVIDPKINKLVKEFNDYLK